MTDAIDFLSRDRRQEMEELDWRSYALYGNFELKIQLIVLYERLPGAGVCGQELHISEVGERSRHVTQLRPDARLPSLSYYFHIALRGPYMSFEGHFVYRSSSGVHLPELRCGAYRTSPVDLSGRMRSRFGFSEDLGSQRFCTRGSRSLPNHPNPLSLSETAAAVCRESLNV